MLSIRVAAVMFFSTMALCAQTPETAADRQPPDSDSAMAFKFILPETSQIQWNGLPQPEPLSFKLDGRSSSVAEKKDLQLAELSKPLLAAYPIPQASKANTPTLGSGYFTLRKIHKYASFATLPLLAAEAVVGQKLLDERDAESKSLRSVHSGLSAGVGVLFGVETVTGVWNMLEARKVGPINKKRLFHGILMLVADAGFAATAATAPHHDNHNSASTHQAIAYSSIGVAAFGYVYGLIAK
jgi:hypothetical protein